jgi:hypothetical protein
MADKFVGRFNSFDIFAQSLDHFIYRGVSCLPPFLDFLFLLALLDPNYCPILLLLLWGSKFIIY